MRRMFRGEYRHVRVCLRAGKSRRNFSVGSDGVIGVMVVGGSLEDHDPYGERDANYENGN